MRNGAAWRGTGVAIVTPFQPHGELDLPALRRLVDHLVEGGVDYLVALGTTGEVSTLTDDEANQVVETTLHQAAGRLPVVVGCGGNNTRAVVQRLQDLERRFDPVAFMSVSPAYTKPTQEGLLEHYTQVCGAVSKPVILYNVPARTGSNLLPETVLRIADRNPNAVAIKEASGSLAQGLALLKARPLGFEVLSGDDNLGLAQLGVGYGGVISVVANALPATYARMVRAALNHDFATAQRLNLELQEPMNLIYTENNPSGIKALLQVMGVCESAVRLPLVPATPGLVEKLKATMAATQA